MKNFVQFSDARDGAKCFVRRSAITAVWQQGKDVCVRAGGGVYVVKGTMSKVMKKLGLPEESFEDARERWKTDNDLQGMCIPGLD